MRAGGGNFKSFGNDPPSDELVKSNGRHPCVAPKKSRGRRISQDILLGKFQQHPSDPFGAMGRSGGHSPKLPRRFTFPLIQMKRPAPDGDIRREGCKRAVMPARGQLVPGENRHVARQPLPQYVMAQCHNLIDSRPANRDIGYCRHDAISPRRAESSGAGRSCPSPRAIRSQRA